MPKAELLEHAAGGRVPGEVRGVQPNEPELGEGVVNHGLACLRAESLAPVGHPDPVAELGLMTGLDGH